MSLVFDNLSGGGTGGGGTFSGGMSTLGNTAGTTGMVNGQLVFVGGSNITLSQSVNGQSATLTINGGAAGSGLTNIKVSAGTLSQLRSDLTFGDAHGISFGLDAGTITASYQQGVNQIDAGGGGVAANIISFGDSNGLSFYITNGSVVGSYTVPSVTGFAGTGFTSATTAGTAVVGTLNSNGISLGIPKYITTAMASDRGTDFVQATAAFNGTNASGTIASNAISVSVAAPIPIATAVNAVASANSTGTVTRYAPEDHKHAGIGAVGISTSGNTAGTTGSKQGTYWFEGGNNVTVSQITSNNGSHTLVISGAATAAQSNQTLGLYMSSNTTSSVSSGTVNATAMTFRGMGIASVGYSGGEVIVSVPSGGGGITNVRVSAGTTSNLLSALTFADSNGVSWGINASTITATVSTYTPVDIATQVYAVASANSTGTVTRWAPEDHHHAGIGAVGISTSGNTAGTTGSEQGTYWFEGGTNITLSQITSNNGSHTLRIVGASGGGAAMTFSAGTLTETLASLVFSNSNGVSFGLNGSTLTATVSTYSTVGTATTVAAVASANSVGTITRWAAEDHAHAGVAAIGISTSGNTAGTTGSEQGTYWLQGSNAVTLSQITSNNGSHTLVIAGPMADGTMSMWPYPLPGSTAFSTYYSGSTSQGAGGNSTQTGYTFSLYVVPLPLPGHLAFSELRLGISNSRSASSTGSVTQVYSVGLYSNNASTLSLLQPYYGGLYFTQNSATAQTWSVWTASTGSQSVGAGAFAGIRAASVYSSQGNISANSQMEPGLKWIRVDNGVATTVTEGQYYAVLGFASASSGGNVYANVGILQSNAISSSPVPDLGRENSTQTSNYLPAWGAISTTFTSQSNVLGFFPLPNAINIANMTMSNSSGERYHFPMMRNHS